MNYANKNARPIERLVIVSASGVTVDKDSNISIRCPKCLAWKNLRDFGIRNMTPRAEHRNQPYCKPCRGGK